MMFSAAEGGEAEADHWQHRHHLQQQEEDERQERLSSSLRRSRRSTTAMSTPTCPGRRIRRRRRRVQSAVATLAAAAASALLLTPSTTTNGLCRAQQPPTFPTAKFDTTAMHKTNMCERQKMLYNDTLELPDALSGLELSVVMTDYTSPASQIFFALNDDGVIDPDHPGTFVVVMDELAKRAGFTWRDSYGVVSPIDPDVDGNRTWSQLLEWEVETYDIAMGKWDRSVERMSHGISFPEGWYDASMILVESVSNEAARSLNIWSFLLPFKAGVWLMIGAATVVSGVVYWLLERMNAQADERELQDKPGAAIYYSAITFTGHFEFRPNTPSAKILSFSLTFWALIVGAAYTANLASFLVARHKPTFTVRSIEEAVLLGASVCIQRGVMADDYISNRYPTAILERRKDEKEVLDSVKAGECAAAILPMASYQTYQRNPEINTDCTLSWQGKVEMIVPSGIVTAIDTGTLCTSLISYVLDLHLTDMKADGFLDLVWEAHLQRAGDQNCLEQSASAEGGGGGGGGGVEDDGDDETFSLSLREMSGIFIVHAVLMLVAVTIAVVQYYLNKRTERLAGGEQGQVSGMVGKDLSFSSSSPPKGGKGKQLPDNKKPGYGRRGTAMTEEIQETPNASIQTWNTRTGASTVQEGDASASSSSSSAGCSSSFSKAIMGGTTNSSLQDLFDRASPAATVAFAAEPVVYEHHDHDEEHCHQGQQDGIATAGTRKSPLEEQEEGVLLAQQIPFAAALLPPGFDNSGAADGVMKNATSTKFPSTCESEQSNQTYESACESIHPPKTHNMELPLHLEP